MTSVVYLRRMHPQLQIHAVTQEKEDNDAVRDADAYAAVAGLDLPGWGMTPHPENVVAQFRTDA